MRRRVPRAVLAITCALSSSLTSAALAAPPAVRLDVTPPSAVSAATTVTLHLPARVAAVEGRLLVEAGTAELVGVAAAEGGVAMTPIDVPGGFAFGAFGLRPGGGRTSLHLVVAPKVEGRVAVRVVVDAAADASGRRLTLPDAHLETSLRVGASARQFDAPRGAPRGGPPRLGGAARKLVGRGQTITGDDLAAFRSGWYRSRIGDGSCAPLAGPAADANGDGCVDVVDAQALTATFGTEAGPAVELDGAVGWLDSQMVASAGAAPPPASAAVAAPRTFVVTSTSDTPDASPGNGICANSAGQCTLRAAITEANWNSGVDRIEFNLPGSAPVRIQINSTLGNIGSSSGGMVIDGYSQPGSRVNTATFGTNAIPGVEIRGPGNNLGMGFYVPYGGNTIRGLQITDVSRAIFVDGVAARDNLIAGNFIGFRPDNSLPARGKAGVVLNNGANQNRIGSPNLADRNVIGNFEKGIWSYGAGTDGNVSQNNVLCMRANGSTATCQIGLDHDFGPKNSLVGGTGTNERNVIGPTNLNGIEFSHGWNPSTRQSTTTWQINGHRVIGNWIGFRWDGEYSASYRTAQNVPTHDNGQGVNIYDGTNNNVVEGNHLAAVYGGMSSSMSNSTGNVFRDNIIGESPLGQAAPLARWGIYFLSNTRGHVVEGNVIRNAGYGGVAILDPSTRDVRISRNVVTGTSGPAIHLTPNPDGSGGANLLLPVPVIGSASTSQASGTGIPGATVEVFAASRPAGQAGLPTQFLGSALVAGNGTWNAPFGSSIADGSRVTALQIRPDGNTTMLSPNVTASGPGTPPPAPVANFTWQQSSTSLAVSFSDTSTNGPATWQWQFGDGGTSSQANPTRTYASAGSYVVVLTVTNGGGSDQVSKTVQVQDPISPPSDVLASDTFGRSVSNGWGAADVGGSYTLEGSSSSFDVGSGVGQMTLPSRGANRAVFLGDVSARDVDVRVRLTADEASSGSPHYLYAVVRRNGNNAYRPKVIIQPDGSVMVHAGVVVNNGESSVAPPVVVPGLTYSPGTAIWLRAQVEGASPTTIRVKAWLAGEAEPAGWQFVATNSVSATQSAGAVGLRVYSNATNAPYAFGFDEFTVTALP